MLTKHVRKRMSLRGISRKAIDLAVRFGRTIYARGAVFKVIGKREIRKHDDEPELADLDGLHVVMDQGGTIITAYRNRRFRRKNFHKRWRTGREVFQEVRKSRLATDS